jgi:mRNA interferase MazF
MVIFQGDVFWVEAGESSGASPGYRRPFVVIQNDIFNQSRIETVVACALSTNLHLAQSPGNVLLKAEEANLPKQSVVNISQIFTMDKRDLTEKIGSLSPRSLDRVLTGVNQLIEPV